VTAIVPQTSNHGIDMAGRRAARLAAVQAVYQMELTGLDAEAVIDEFLAHRFPPDLELTPAGRPDEDFFSDIVRGVPRRQTDIDSAIAKCLADDWKFSRIDSILRAILRAAAYELVGRPDVPAKAVIDEYLEITHAFFQGDEVGFVNAALDRMARDKRAAEMGKTQRDEDPKA
jgi:transcription antitermination protein NusB